MFPDFKILVKRTHGKDKGKYVWFYNIAVGSIGIYQENKMLASVKDTLSPPLQYIGIEDKNDNPIYEGDIVKVINAGIEIDKFIIPINKEIFYVEKFGSCFGLRSYDEERKGYLFRGLIFKSIEVIGNIHEGVTRLADSLRIRRKE